MISRACENPEKRDSEESLLTFVNLFPFIMTLGYSR